MPRRTSDAYLFLSRASILASPEERPCSPPHRGPVNRVSVSETTSTEGVRRAAGVPEVFDRAALLRG